LKGSEPDLRFSDCRLEIRRRPRVLQSQRLEGPLSFYVGELTAPVFDAIRQDARFPHVLEKAGVLVQYREAQAEVLAWKKKNGQP
jgi:hypothetical protein